MQNSTKYIYIYNIININNYIKNITCSRNFAISNGINLPIYGRNGFCEFCFYKKTFGSTTSHSCASMNSVTGTFPKQQCNKSENDIDSTSNILFSA